MWENVEARIAENDRDGAVPLRRAFWEEIAKADLRPGSTVTKKMVGFETAAGEQLLWELSSQATSFHMLRKWSEKVTSIGLDPEPEPFGQDGTGRHSALNAKGSFRGLDCIRVRVDSVDQLKALLSVLIGDSGDLVIDPAAITRWIDVVRTMFPDFRQFDPPDGEFDQRERDYKLETARNLRAGLEAASTDSEVLEAVLTSISQKSSNLLDWRTSLPLMSNGDGDKERLQPALVRLARAALGPPEAHGAAMDEFVAVWRAAVPNPSDDPPRQIAEFLFFHLWPDTASYIRNTVRQDLWREGTGRPFPRHPQVSATYADELRFMRAVRAAFAERGLAPRDMIDVQSALWVVSRYRDESTGIDRLSVEGAMDAIDRHRDGVERTEILDRFGEPKDYWVLSTRDRPNRVYPTKPIIGVIRKKTEFSGGWGLKHDAASLLHAAGFVIVGENGEAVPLPEQYTHLDRGPERVRLCAVNYFVEPAREDQRSQVEVRVGDLHRLLGPSFTVADVSDSISDPVFADTAGITLIGRSGAAQSEDETFTFAFEQTGKTEPMTSTEIALPTNLILYGPPGTGKTYHTAFEAVRLCLGDQAADAMRNDRKAVMEAYRTLVSEGRVEFVTFHQSMSYEEFVEGLRPETGSSGGAELSDGSAQGGGFTLKVKDGLFKRISERARLDTGAASEGSSRLDRKKKIYRLGLTSSGWKSKLDRALALGRIDWLHGGDRDWSAPEFEEWEAIKAVRQVEDPQIKGNSPEVYGTWVVRSDAEVGDMIMLTARTGNIVALGRIAGPYVFEPPSATEPPRHSRAVDWIWSDPQGVDREGIYPNPFTSFHPIYSLEPELIGWDLLEETVFGESAARPTQSARPHVLIIDEINRANISKVFGELITLLEPDKRLGMENEIRLQLPYSKTLFGVPANLHIIGTMNTADRSIALLDTALRRRFTFRELMPDPSVLPEVVDGIALRRLLQTLNERIEYLFDREHQIGHAYFSACQSRADIEDVLRYKVIPLLAEYFYEDWSRVAAVLGDAAQGRSRFLTARVLPVPDGLGDDDTREPRMRWTLNDRFDLSEFAA
ncbi:AAA family ATPase [Rhodobacteraceae bacterium HSP-20]|uniref:AAA family ATPase n=1 Tax=Paragemmobacter amnigenus TaxID=2852097 RepID=A0ABS6J4F7_9RHOB|nr:AAA family ATPase [Rhodobacter amnigenus]MBU9697275.1 AAA family ATPase [Rhodobacter amnigenus]MBV4388502.1 AAA family ATPase [Rhodobacter amnigenus]